MEQDSGSKTIETQGTGNFTAFLESLVDFEWLKKAEPFTNVDPAKKAIKYIVNVSLKENEITTLQKEQFEHEWKFHVEYEIEMMPKQNKFPADWTYTFEFNYMPRDGGPVVIK